MTGTRTLSREKVFGCPAAPLDREAKIRIMHSAKAYNARRRQPGQHIGPLTRTFLEVLRALLWGFHNGQTGKCFPSYDAIAAKAGCSRDTVCQAIKALEAANVLAWVHRLSRVRFQGLPRLIRTSNAYLFRDPLPQASRQSENPARTCLPDSSLVKPGMPEPLRAALERLETAMRARRAA